MRQLRFLAGTVVMILAGCQSASDSGATSEAEKATSIPSYTKPAVDADQGDLFLPNGFGALVVADSTGPARHLAVRENGDVYIKLRTIGKGPGSVALRDTNQDGRADIIRPFGGYPNDGSFATEMRIHNGYLYFSTELRIYRQKLTPGSLIPEDSPELLVTDPHPIRWHNAKSLAFDGQGGMYVTFSAPTNNCEDWTTVTGNTYADVRGYQPCPQLVNHAGIWRFDDSKPGQTQRDGHKYATGIRSVVAMAWNRDDHSLYAINHGRDYLYSHAPQYYRPWHDAVLPAEEFINIKPDDDFGWPYTYYDPFLKRRVVAPEYGGDGKKEATGYADPLMGLPAHWAPNDLLFYRGKQFPSRYREGAFIAFHGSTNRKPYIQGGYIVAFVPMKDGRVTGSWEVFADGFTGVEKVNQMQDARYRPMGLAEGPDGSLYISESRKGKIWRILFDEKLETFGAKDLADMEKRKSLSHLRVPDVQKDLAVE